MRVRKEVSACTALSRGVPLLTSLPSRSLQSLVSGGPVIYSQIGSHLHDSQLKSGAGLGGGEWPETKAGPELGEKMLDYFRSES